MNHSNAADRFYATGPTGERRYAPSLDEALRHFEQNQNNQGGQDGFIPREQGDRYYHENIKKGIHQQYIQERNQLFGGHRQNYEFKTELLRNGYTSFSGADTTVSVLFKYGKPIVIGEAQTMTYSTYTVTSPVYNLGMNKPSGFVKGPRTIAGTIIFTVFDRHALISAFHYAYDNHLDAKCLDKDYLSDELPPFDLQVTFMNEYGQSSGLTVHDVRITTEGQVMSIEDMITENTMQYVASDITLMQPNFVEEPI